MRFDTSQHESADASERRVLLSQRRYVLIKVGSTLVVEAAILFVVLFYPWLLRNQAPSWSGIILFGLVQVIALLLLFVQKLKSRRQENAPF